MIRTRLIALAVFLVFMGQSSKGQDDVMRWVEQVSTQSQGYAQKKEYKKAIECLEMIVEKIKSTPFEGLTASIMDMIDMNTFSMYADRASVYAKEKNYKRSNECYKELLSKIKSTKVGSLLPTVKNMMALNYLNIAVPLLKEKSFLESKMYLDSAVMYVNPTSTTARDVNRWMGNWYQRQVTELLINHNDPLNGISLCKKGEECYRQAKDTIKCFELQLNRAIFLDSASKEEDAIDLLNIILKSSEGRSALNTVRGRSFLELGRIELKRENLQQAIECLEQSYELCLENESRVYAKLAASTLARIFDGIIPDVSKNKLWQQRVNVLETE